MASDDDLIITLVSTNGDKFPVPAYHLNHTDMLSCSPLKLRENDDRAVDIALDTSDLKILVAYVIDDSASITTQLSWDTVKRILPVCDTFGFEHVAVRLLNSGFAISDANSWDIFCFAAGHNQYPLARAVISTLSFSQVGTSPFRDMTSAMIDQCSKPYLAQLLLAVGRARGGRAGPMDYSCWREVADEFLRP